MSENIHDAASSLVAPLEVRDRLFERLARARTGSTHPSRLELQSIAGWAAVVLLVLVVGLKVLHNGGAQHQQPVLAALAGEHARALGSLSIRSSNPSDITRWMKSQVPFAIQVPVFADVSLSGARVVEMDGARGVLIEYGIGGEPVSYFIVPRTDDAETPAKAVVHETAWEGYRIMSWNEPGLLHAFIGNVPASKLRQLARDCIEMERKTTA